MPPPAQVTQWLRTTYPKPTVDPAWLEGCYDWIESELQLNPAKDMDAIVYNIETQLLQSNLSDSMLAGTGLPHDVAELDNTKLTGAPVLVEVISITEIGHSAFNLQNVRQARIERADLAGLAEQEDAGEGQEGEDDDPVPKYPRGMLKLELSDGSTTLQAIEYRRLPDLELGSTPLGYKMLLKNVFVRRGIAWLEPGNVVLKGYQTEERQAMADTIFVRGLRKRLGKPEDDPIPPIPNGGRAENAAPRQASAPQAPPPQPPAARSPLSPIKEPPEPPAAGPSNGHDDDIEQPRRRKLPARPRTPSPDPPPRKPLSSSRFFAESSSTSGRTQKLATELKLSPHRQAPLPPAPGDIDDDSPGPSRKPPKFEGSKGRDVVVHLDDDVVASGGDASNASPRSSDYEFGFEFDGELLEKLDQVEKQAYGENETVARSTTVVSRSVHVSPARPAIDLDVITIDDDDEGQEEKENVPVPTRHVRRRIQDEDIIELSD